MTFSFPKIRPQEVEQFKRKAREYPTPEGKRINVCSIVAMTLIKPGVFYYRQREAGWPGLNGKKLGGLPLKISGHGMMEDTFLEDQVEKAMETPVDTNGIILINGELRYKPKRVCQEWGISIDTLGNWDRWNPYLEHGTNPQSFRDPLSGRWTRTYTKEVVQEVKNKMHEAKQGRFVDTKGRAWLSFEQLVKELRELMVNLGSKKVWKHTVMVVWPKSCRYVEDGKLERKKFGFLQYGGSQAVWFLEKHVLQIKVGLSRLAASLSDKKKKAISGTTRGTTFDGVFDEPNGRRLTLAKAASEQDQFSLPALYTYIRKLPGDFSTIFPEGCLPHETRKMPGKTNTEVETVLQSDLMELAEGIENILRAGNKKIGKRKSHAEICHHFGVAKVSDRIKVVQLLRSLRERGIIQPIEITRKTGGRGWARAWFYELTEIERFLNSQNIVEAANEYLNPTVINQDNSPQQEKRGDSAITQGPREDKTPGLLGQTAELERPLSAVERAIQIYLRDPNQTIREVARKTPCDAAYLCRDERFKRLRKAYQVNPPKGSKSKDGSIEAISSEESQVDR